MGFVRSFRRQMSRQMKQSEIAAKKRSRKVLFESLEPRLLLSADLDPVAGILSSAIGQLDGDLDTFFNSSGSDYSLNIPLPLVNMVEGSGFDDAYKKAPTINELLSLTVDYTHDGDTSDEDEATFDGYDSDNDGKVEFTEFFQEFFIDKITDKLSTIASGPAYIPNDFANWLDTNLDFALNTTGISSSKIGYESVSLDVNATYSNTNQVGYELDFTFIAIKELPIDLGRAADDYGLSFPEGVTVTTTVSFDMDFGVLTSGESAFLSDDVYLEVKDLKASVNANTLLAIDFNLGFLGLTAGGASNITLDAEVEADFVDPTAPAALGFSEGQYDVKFHDGTMTATSTPSAYDLTDDAEFILRVGDSDARTVKVTDGLTNSNGDLGALIYDVNAALGIAGLGDVVDADNNGGHIRLSVVDQNFSDLGFAGSEVTWDGSAQTATSAPTYSTAIAFVLSVDHETPQLISIVGAATIDGIVTQLTSALSGTGVTASKVDIGGSVFRIKLDPGSHHMQVSNDLTFDSKISYSDLTETSTADLLNFSVNTEDAGIVLYADIKSGIDGLSATGLEISADFTGTVFDQALDGSAPDSKDQQRIDLSPTFTGFGPLLNFKDFSASTVIGQIQQFGNWLGGVGDSELFSAIDIPFSAGDLSDVLDFADLIADTLLYDDGDDGIGGAVGDTDKLLELVDGALVPVFTNAQELAHELGASGLNLLENSIDGTPLHYDSGTDVLTYDINISHDLIDIEVPIDFNFDLAPLLNISSFSKVVLDATAGLKITLGLDLSDTGGGTLLESTTLASLGIDMTAVESELALTTTNNPRIVYGRLTNDATFDITVGTNTYRVTVDTDDTDTNLTVDDLVSDIDLALQHVQKKVGDEFTGDHNLKSLHSFAIGKDTSNLNRLILSSTSTDFTVTADTGDPAINELGFKATHEAEGSPYSVTTTKDAPRHVGQLTENAVMTVTIDGVCYTVTLEAGETDANRTIIDLIKDVDNALSEPSLLSDAVTVTALSTSANFDVSINGAAAVSVSVTSSSMDGSAYVEFDGGTAADVTEDTITLTSHTFITGDKVVYTNGGGTSIDGLVHSAEYFVIVVDSATIKLASSFDEANANIAIDLLALGVGAAHWLSDTANAEFQDLVNDINRAFIGTSLDGFVRAEAYEWNGNDYIRLKAIDDSVATLQLSVTESDPADTELKLPTGITLCANLQEKIEVLSQGDSLVLRAYAEKFTFDGADKVDVDNDTITIGSHDFVTGREVTYSAGTGTLIGGLTEGATYYVIIDSSTSIKLATSEANALAGTAIDITAAGSGSAHLSTVPGISAFTVAGSGTGYTELGFGSSQSANTDDLRIYLSDNTVNGGKGYYDVSLDGATQISHIISEIHAATAGVLVEINPDNNTGLRLTDSTFTGSASDPLFQVGPVNASPAAIMLGILAIDPIGDDNVDGVIDAEDGDGMITGAPLTGIDLMDRFFIDNVDLWADFSLSAKQPFTGLAIDGSDDHKIIHSDFDLEHVGQYVDITGGTNFTTGRYKIVSVDATTNTAALDGDVGDTGATGGTAEIKAQATAAFGFVGVTLIGDGSLSGKVTTGLKGTSPLTLSELIDGLGDITSIVDNPTITNDSGTLTLNIELEPDFSGIFLGGTPQIVINIASIGDPFTITEYSSPTWVSDNSFSVVATATDLTGVFTKGSVIDVELGSPVVPAEILSSSYDGVNTTTVTLVSDVLSGGTLAKVFTPVPPAITVSELDLGDLPSFDDLSFDSILEALKQLASFLSSIQGFELFDQDIPLINKSVNDLMGLADTFTQALSDIENDPAATLQVLEDKIENAFGLPADGSGPFGINLSLDTNILKFELDLGVDFNESIGLEIPDFLNLGDLGIPGLSGFAGLTGSADLNASGSLTASFDFGIDLSTLTTDPLETDIYIYDTTGVAATLSASGENLSFKAGIGSLGLTIQNHTEHDSEIAISGGFSAGIDAVANTGDKALIGDIDFDGVNFDTTITGTIDGTLPTFFPIDSKYIGNITVSGNLEDIPDIQFITDTITTPLADHIVIDAGEVIEGIKNFDFANQFDLFDNILLAVDGIDMFFEGVQYVLDTDVFGDLDVPLLGDAFTYGVDFVEDFRKDFIGPFRDLIEKVENAADDFADADKNLISQFLNDTLGSLLQATEYDSSDAPAVDEFQGYYGPDANKKIALTTNLDDYLDGGSTELKDTYIQWNFAIGDTYTFGTDFGFDIGLPGLGLKADGDVSVEIGWDIDFGFGISFQDGFYVDISDGNELTAYVDVDLGDSTLAGTLGFLQLSATVDPVTDLGLAFEIDIIEKGASGDDAKKLQFSELGKVGFETGIAAAADIDLDLALEFSSTIVGSNASGFPKLGADFILDWGIGSYNSGDPEASTFVPLSGIGDAMSDGLHLVEFQDITLDLGSYVSDVLGPIVGSVQEYTEPIQPLIDFITTPFPVLSDFGLNITPLDLAAMYGSFDPGLIYAIADIITLVNSIPDPDTVGALQLNFGDMTLFDSALDPDLFAEIDLTDPNLNLRDSLDVIVANAEDLLSEVFGDNWFTDTLGSLAGEAADIMGDLTEEASDVNPWAFPILEDPMQAFGLLMGRPAVLVTYDMAPLEFEFEYSQFFPIYGPLGVSINIEFGAVIDFAFGYDTLGIQEFVDSDFRNPLLLFDGFYVSDTDLPTGDFGTDVPELVLTGGLWAAAELNLGVARAGVGGGVFIEIDFDLFDPDRDGRVRIKEIIGNIVNEWEYGNPALAPLAIFDVHGEITAELFAFLKIDLFILEIDKRWQITPPITLLEFDIPFTRPPVLATELEGGDLQINAGDFADQRLNGNLDDFGEHFVVEQGSSGSEVIVRAPGLWEDGQTYSMDPTGTIIFKGGEGDDTFDATGITGNFLFEIEGGSGNDTIILSASPGAPGAAVIKGSEGDDTIYGGSGDDIIYGLKGNDTIYGGGGNDIIFADDGRIGSESITAFFNPLDDGDDKIYGGGGNDIIFGSGGTDTIYGDDDVSVSGDPDNDLIIGDGGKLTFANDSVDKIVANVIEVTGTQRDRLDPQGGNDILIGSAGADIIYGGTGNDIIDGGAGIDTLYGEEGFDTIYGGSDVDTIYGGAGGDTIYGERDTVAVAGKYDSQDSGSAAGDFIYGEDGRDIIFGDTGLNNGSADYGDDEIYGGAGADIIDGDAGDDTIYGEGDPDTIYGGTGQDTIDGGAGGDIIYGDRGPEDLADTGSPTSAWNPNVYGTNTASDYIFGETYSNDTPGTESADDLIFVRSGSDFIDGQGGSDTYKISLLGADNNGFINIYDSGGSSTESDYMKIRGTMYDDTFLLRKSTSSSGLSFVALLNEAPYAERINYWSVEGGIGLERMLVSGLFGDDHFASDDVGTDTTIEGNEGEDTFQVGQLYNSPRDICASEYNNIEPEDVFATIETTVGWLSDGINKPMTIYGGVGEDYFTVFHNKAVLSLFGEDGDDTFLIKAFAMAGSSEPFRDRTDISGGAGVDLVQYAMNAPVNIDGGDGFDRVIIIGTEFGDDFVITKDGVYGAGLNVNFVNIESLAVDGAEGDDRFYVMSTGENFITELFGGLGSDTFNMSGGTPPIISNDLRGHSGVITHEIENTGTNYDETIIAGISANVADNDTADPVVIISEPDGSTVITEGGPADYYYIVLSKAPINPVTVLVNAPVQTVDQFERKAKMFQLSSPTEVGPPKQDGTTISLVFDSTNWFIPQQVNVSAPDDGDATDDETIVMDVRDPGDYDDNAIEGDQTGFINHVVNTSIGIKGSPTHVPVVAQDPYDSTKYTTLFTDSSANFDPLTIGFNLAGYILQITDGPGAGQSLRILEVYDNDTLTLDGKFRECEGVEIGVESKYKIVRDIEANRAITVLVHDNDKAGVTVTETGISTDLFEGGASDTIEVVLARQPEDSNVTVTLTSNDGQLTFSGTTLNFSKTDGDSNAWDVPQTVTVSADDDSIREGFHHGLITFGSTGGDSDDLELVSQETVTLTEEQAYVGLMNRPAAGSGETYLVSEVLVDGTARSADLLEVVSNKIVFLTPDGDYDMLEIGTVVKVTYQYATVGYDGLYVKPLLTDIADDEVAQVKITQTGGFTDVIEIGGEVTSATNTSVYDSNANWGVNTLTGYLIKVSEGTGEGQVRTVTNNTINTIIVDSVWDTNPDGSSRYEIILTHAVPWTDTYSVVLTQAPTGEVEILIDPQQTKTSAGKVINWGEQVAVTTDPVSAPGAVHNPDGTVTLTFTSSNWSTPQVIEVTAIDDSKYDGDDTQVFAPEPHTITDIQGPLYLYGEGGNGSIVDFEPTMLHYETDHMIETDVIESVGVDGITITVPKGTLIDAGELLNDVIHDLIKDGASDEDVLDAFVEEMLTVTLADGVYIDEDTLGSEFLKEIGQFRLIVDIFDNGDETVFLTLNEAWDLSKSWEKSTVDSYDQITEYTLTHMSPNFFADETEKIDYLFVYNEDSQADNEIASRAGWLTDSSILDEYGVAKYIGNSIVENFVVDQDGKWLRGFGMAAEDLSLGGVYHPRGITYGDMEVVEINLGDGIDNFTVEDTHVRADGYQTWTIINSGDEVEEGAGDLITLELDSNVEELHAGTATDSSTYTLTDNLASFEDNGNNTLVGYLVEITGGTGLGQQRIIASHDATTLTFDTAWSVALDTISEYRILGAELYTGTATSDESVDSNTIEDTAQSFTTENGGLSGYVVEIIDGAGIGTKREIIANTATELTVSSTWNSVLDSTTVYRIYGDQDGPISINAQGGDDEVEASASSIPLVIFGGDGVDRIAGGSADDIIFGDRGRVEYVNEDGKIVTLLGLAREKLDPQYITAFSTNTLTDDDGPLSINEDFPVWTIDMQGLEGYMLSTPDGRGFGQRVQIIDNTADVLTVTPEWELNDAETEINLKILPPLYDPETDFDSSDPQNNPTKYRISLVPEDQTDGIKRDPNLIIAVDPEVGADDVIIGNDGNDRIFGGAADDTINGNLGDDIIFGDHGRLDYTPAEVGGEDGPALGDFVSATLNRIRTTYDDNGGGDTIYGDEDEDIILGGFNTEATTDDLYGNSGDDIILGDNGLLLFSPNEDTPADPRDVYLDSVETIAHAIGGDDLISGNAGDDIAMGGTAADTIYGDDASAFAADADGEDILLGDNGKITLTGNDLGRLNAFGSGINLIETTDIVNTTGGGDTIEGNAQADIILAGVNNGETDIVYGDRTDPTPTSTGNDDDDVILGDNGLFDFAYGNTDLTTLDLVHSSAYAGVTVLGGYDTLSGNAGNDVVIGGTFNDTMYGDDAGGTAADADGEDIMLGDNADIFLSGDGPGRLYVLGSIVNYFVTTDYETNSGGTDSIFGNAAVDFIAGGVDSDTIYGDKAVAVPAYDGDDFILGDNAIFEFELASDDVTDLGRPDVVAYLGGTTLPLDPSSTTLDRVMTIDPTLGDDDIIHGDGGGDVIFGGTGRDQIWGDSDNDNPVDNAVDGDGADIIFGDHAKLYPTLPTVNAFFINNNFFSIDTSEDDGFDTDGVIEFEPGTDFEDTIFGSGGDDTIIGGQDDDILFGGEDDDILIGGHNVVGGHDEIDNMDQALQDAILTGVLADLDPSDINDVNDIMDGDGDEDVLAGDNAIVIRQNAFTTEFLLNSESPRYQQLEVGSTAIYSMETQILGGLYDVDVGFSPNIEGTPQAEPESVVGYSVILLDHSEGIATAAAESPTAPRVFGNDVMAGGAHNDDMFGQLGDDIMQGDGSITPTDDIVIFDPSPAVDPSFTIPDNQTAEPITYFEVQGQNLLFNVFEDNDDTDDYGYTDGDDYMEGNAGNDRMYGNLGQDDIIGDNSSLFGLDDSTAVFYGVPIGDFARPTGADMLYGGAGNPTRLARNDFVGDDTTAPGSDDPQIPFENRHARDADVIMGDNANIYCVVDGTTGNYLQFSYDQDLGYESRGSLRIVPRAVEFLDYGYTYTDLADPFSLSFDARGIGDLMYGESGDDIIHGMTGDDVLFGNSEDDDLYGEAGNDWISGGTGEDGILGDDGLIKTSRNDLVAEPLYSIGALNPEQTLIKKNDPVDTNALNAEISTPGNIQRAIINVEGSLKKTVDLLAFDAGIASVGVNDIIFGGLNSDSIHAGAGDDAVSGAEALPDYYYGGTFGFAMINDLLQKQQEAPANTGDPVADDPFWFSFAPYNPGDILRYEGNTLSEEDDPHGKSNQEFALYDEFYPRRKIMLDANGEAVEHSDDSVYDFLLNFDETEGPLGYEFLGDDAAMMTDGDDKIFGDLGHDWIVGGTGRDNMYGGRGDDLLNMDDNHDSGPGGKVGPHDPPPDPLDNTASDEFQAYADIAYGGAGRDVLILNTGADRAIDWVGEYNSYIVPFAPFGAFHISRTLQPQLPEFLYALSESDGIDTTVPDGARYVEQKGLDVRIDPPDSLRQGEPYGELGMVRQMDYDWFNQTGAPNDPQPGNLQGKREIMRRELFQDTVAPKGAFAETVGIWTANDGKLEAAPVLLGEDAVSIYHLDQMQPSYMEALVTVNVDKDKAGFKSNAYIIYDYQSSTDFKFAGVDVGIDKIQIGHYTVDGWIVDIQTPMQLKANTDYDLTLVMYGTLATLWVDETVSLNFDFSDPLYDFGMIGLATNNAVARFDDWQVQKLPPTLTFQFTEDFAEASTNPFEEQMGDWMIVDGHYSGSVAEGDRAITTWAIEVATWSLLEFEALINTETTGGLIFDYYDADNFKFTAIDAIADQVVIGHHTSKGWFIDASVDASIETGTSYNLGISMLGTSVSVTLNDQAVVGHVFNSLLTDGFIGLLSKDGATLFDDVVVQGDDPAYAENLTAAAAPDVFIESDSFLTYDALDAIVDEAIERWTDALGIDDALVASLHEVSFQIVDFSDLTLGRAFEDTILIDTDAAGYGWFVDTTPYDDVEFSRLNEEGELVADSASDAYGDMDLLTVVMHELGHVLGLEDLDPDTHDLMSETLDAGVRQLADDQINADSVEVNEAEDLASLVVMDTAINEAEAIAPAPAKYGSSWLTDFLTNGAGKRYNKFDPKDDIKIEVFDDDEKLNKEV